MAEDQHEVDSLKQLAQQFTAVDKDSQSEKKKPKKK